MLNFHSLRHITLRNYFKLYHCCLQVRNSVFSMLCSRIFIIKILIPIIMGDFSTLIHIVNHIRVLIFTYFANITYQSFSKCLCFVLTHGGASGFPSSSKDLRVWCNLINSSFNILIQCYVSIIYGSYYSIWY